MPTYWKSSTIRRKLRRELWWKGVPWGTPPHVHLSDDRYALPSMQDIYRMLDAGRVYTRRWQKERFDCDDFAWLFQAVMCEDVYGRTDLSHGWAAGIIWGCFPTPHAINWAYIDGKLRFIEPQSKRGIWKPRKKDKRISLIAG